MQFLLQLFLQCTSIHAPIQSWPDINMNRVNQSGILRGRVVLIEEWGSSPSWTTKHCEQSWNCMHKKNDCTTPGFFPVLCRSGQRKGDGVGEGMGGGNNHGFVIEMHTLHIHTAVAWSRWRWHVLFPANCGSWQSKQIIYIAIHLIAGSETHSHKVLDSASVT